MVELFRTNDPVLLSYLMSVLEEENIEAILPEKWLVFKHHQRNAPMTGAFLCRFIGFNLGLELCLALNGFRVERGKVQSSALDGL